MKFLSHPWRPYWSCALCGQNSVRQPRNSDSAGKFTFKDVRFRNVSKSYTRHSLHQHAYQSTSLSQSSVWLAFGWKAGPWKLIGITWKHWSFPKCHDPQRRASKLAGVLILSLIKRGQIFLNMALNEKLKRIKFVALAIFYKKLYLHFFFWKQKSESDEKLRDE
mgnify:CR=1 FL=1